MFQCRRIASIAVCAVCTGAVAHDVVPKTRQSNLASAIEARDLGAVRLALTFGADPNTAIGSCADRDRPTMTALTYAVLRDSPQLARELIRAGADVNRRDPEGRTPLVVAVEMRSPETCRILLAAGADPNRSGAHRFDRNLSETPMEALARSAQGSPQIVRSFQQNIGIRPDPRSQGCGQNVTAPGVVPEVLAIYDLLRRQGVSPTRDQALAIADLTRPASSPVPCV